ncbi:virulence-associated E family protein [Alicyclobacillus sp. ALC3]|uniref:virulence-associated E family protein n=1 Tax=Alicyclobacillus sp. ALC3 TaxID=2796143 RepID=UPI0023785D3B|nr:virulence-associated E family protein [Alicyclobacillus sp. ALC3]WDL99645.1 virulence-associated protein E [Alicyclobacillus sp. ALC3]
MQYDKQLTISAAGSRRSTHWPAQQVWWSELTERLKVPTRGTETLAEYLALSKSKQDDLKDVGGFVGGTFTGNRRKASSVAGRDLVTLDLDNIPAGNTADVLRRLNGLGCAYVVYSTRKHEEARPRLRVLIPLIRTATVDEYEPIARKLGQLIGIDMCDPTTFEASRLMYWPSCSSDSQYIFQASDKPFVDTDGLLGLYTNWRNVSEWPQVPGTEQTHQRLLSKQEDPTQKHGVIGAFCRVYDIYRALETFLPDAYTEVDGMPDRLTFTGGSTTGGAVVYDNGAFLFSHHATDPVGGKLVNAFDLVRLHRYSELDDDAKPDTPVNKLPSYAAMCEFALQDESVAALLNQERYEQATQDFGVAPDDAANWMKLLRVSPTTGQPAKTIRNVMIVLENDPRLKGRIRKDLFADRILGYAPLPWGARSRAEGAFLWTDEDDKGLRKYMELVLGFSTRDLIDVALGNHATENSFNPVTEYLNSIEWDGIPRLDTVYIDYLGADDHPYTRTVARKAFTAAVARAMTPGCKFDYMTVVCGPQGIGKSTFFTKLGREWFSDSIKTFEGKDAAELIQGVWIVEIGELEAFSKTDIKVIKQFLSKLDDQYRAAYARTTEKHQRRCVFFGTTNDHEYLRDPTGNRRFWSVDVLLQRPTKSVFDDLTGDEIDQIWAEAVMRWRVGEPLHLSDEMEVEAQKRRESHMERDPLQGQIEEFVDRPIPEDWVKWEPGRRSMFWGDGVRDGLKLVPRDRVCAMEIWRECLNERRVMTKIDATRINQVLEMLPGWERAGVQRFGVDYGRQKGFKRVQTDAKVVNFLGQNVNQVPQFVNHPENGSVNHVNQVSRES